MTHRLVLLVTEPTHITRMTSRSARLCGAEVGRGGQLSQIASGASLENAPLRVPHVATW